MKIAFLLSAANLAAAQLRKQHYPVKERNLETPQYTLEDFVREFPLTFSDDSAPKILTPFYIDVFSTSGFLPSNSFGRFEDAMENFLLMELGEVYSSRPRVKSVQTKVTGQQLISRSTSRRLQGISTVETMAEIGTELETQINVTFQNDPSPSDEVVQAVVWRILKGDLSHFTTNLTAITANDENFGSPLEAILKEEGGLSSGNGETGGQAPDNDAGGILSTPQIAKDTDRNIQIIVPLTVGACALFALIALLTLRRRRERIRDDNSFQLNDDMVGDIDVFIDDDASDVFSFEAALSPHQTPKYAVPSLQELSTSSASEENPSITSGLSPIEEKSVGHDDSVQESDIFSGLAESPRNASSSKSVFSIFSGFSRATNGDASTVMISNQTNRKQKAASPTVATAFGSNTANNPLAMPTDGSGKRQSGTPGSRMSSLFTFSEEEEEENKDQDISGFSVITNNPKSPLDTPFDEAKDVVRIPPLGSDPKVQTSQGPTPRNGDVLTPVENGSVAVPNVALSDDESTSSQILGLVATAPVASPDEANEKPTKFNLSRLACSPAAVNGSPKRTKMFFGRLKPTPTTLTDEKGGQEADDLDDLVRQTSNPETSAEIVKADLKWDRPLESKTNAAEAKKFVMSTTSTPPAQLQAPDDEDQELTKSGRRHTKSTADDGTTDYQRETMHMNMTAASFDAVSLSDGSDITGALTPKGLDGNTPVTVPSQTPRALRALNLSCITPAHQLSPPAVSGGNFVAGKTPQSRGTAASTSPGYTGVALDRVLVSDASNLTGPLTPNGSRRGTMTPKSVGSSPISTSYSQASDSSTTRKVITDLIWLEKKIASTKSELVGEEDPTENLKNDDSLSFTSGEPSPTGSTDSTLELGSPKATQLTPRTMQSIVCRDCFAPPGKLKIIIHSTKDGPAVHTVKPGSSLEGHIFAGDLIISVDNVDTRSYSAEQVMKMMTAKTKFERKITVLHFENVVHPRNSTTPRKSLLGGRK